MIGLAPSGKAADVLARSAGCTAVTLAKLLHTAQRDQRLPPVGATVILDEAGMASTDDLDHLVQIARTRRWRIVAVGDPEQLAAVGRGGMFAHWTDSLPAHHLDVVHRFTEPWQADASLALRRGDLDAAQAYVEHGRVQTVHPALVAERIARIHENAGGRGQAVAITTSNAATARSINEEIQWQQHRTRAPGHSIPLADGTRLYVGDRIATRRNDPTLATDAGVSVRNRHTWTVTDIQPDGSVSVSDDTNGFVTLPSSYVAEHVELGWAVTGYGNQGITTDHAVCVIEPGTSRASIYVGLTRGRSKNLAIIVDPTGTADPADALARAIARPSNATTAHAARDRLLRAQGLEPPATTLTPDLVVDDVERTRVVLDQYAESVRHQPPLSRGL